MDKLNLLWWARTKDGQGNKNRPVSIVSAMMQKESDKPVSYATGEDFNRAWKKLTENHNGD